MLQTMTAISVNQGGLGLGLSTSLVGAQVSGGGYPLGSVALSREIKGIFARPRQATAHFTISGGTNGTITSGSPGTILDGGLFFIQGNGATPNMNVEVLVGASAGSAGSILGPTFATTFGGSNVFDVAVMQPAP